MVVKLIRERTLRYKVYFDTTLSFEIELKASLFGHTFSLFSLSRKLLADYKEKNFAFRGRRKMSLYEFEQTVTIEKSHGAYKFFYYNWYELRYGMFSFEGFYFNDEKIASLKILSAGPGSYEKDITVTKEIDHIHLFILFYVAIDYFDLN